MFLHPGGDRNAQPKQSRLGKTTPRVALALALLDQYAERLGDKLPDHEAIHLPECVTKGRQSGFGNAI